jgi:tetratricopeptide (TPR) repeat protein
LLQAAETGRAEEAIARLRQRGVRSPELQVLEEAVKGWGLARTLAARGEFSPAVEAAERARRLLGANRLLELFHSELLRRRESFAELLGKLHEAANEERWREVLELAEQVLAVAPEHGEARALRSRAWQAVGPATVVTTAAPGVGRDPAGEILAPRFLLWIDGVGGYLVCLGARLTFGQAALDAHVDVPLVADVSRLHATLTRDSEGYLLEAVRPIQVNGQSATRALLQAGDRVTLGTSCQFLFRLPVPGSTTARLDLVSGHRLPLAVDGVLLLAETLVLGGEAPSHVTVPELKEPVVLFRNKDGLGVRHKGKLWVDGQESGGRSLLGPQATVTGDDFAFAIEPAGARLGPG